MALKPAAVVLGLVAGCAGTAPHKILVLSPDMVNPVREPAKTGRAETPAGAPAPAEAAPGASRPKPQLAAATPAAPPVNAAPQVMRPVAAQGPIVRMAEHGRVWELELPESSGAYELQIPLAGRPLEAQTRADQELLGKTQPEKKSYLGALARISDLFEHHRYELALIETADLETAYPDEARLQAMKGSLYQKLGKNKLAREAWKRALEIEPSNTSVVQALRELGED